MPFLAAVLSIAAAEPESIGAMIRTFAPSAMHWSACVFCFCGSPCAFTTRAPTPAALNAFCRAGRSNCSQRTDVFVSGIRAQMVMPALRLLELALAEATTTIATTPTIPSSRTGDLRKTLFTVRSPSCSVAFGRAALARVPTIDRVEPASIPVHGSETVGFPSPRQVQMWRSSAGFRQPSDPDELVSARGGTPRGAAGTGRVRLQHVSLVIGADGADRARRFYGGLL